MMKVTFSSCFFSGVIGEVQNFEGAIKAKQGHNTPDFHPVIAKVKDVTYGYRLLFVVEQ
jgi:hypothetical protein